MKGERKNSRRRMSMKLSMASITVLLILTAIAVMSLAVTPVIVAAQGVEVTINAPEYVEERATFVATIDVDDVTDLNSAQFELSFDSSVVKVNNVKRDITDGEIGGDEVPIYMCNDVSADSVMVLIMMPIGDGVEELELEDIPTNWIDAEIQIGVEEADDEEDEEDAAEEVSEEVTLVSSNITAWKPAEAVVNDTGGESRTFNISLNQISVISWQINGTEVQTNESVTEASFTKTADIGSWNVSAIATNSTTGLSDMHTWIWNVTRTTIVTPTEVVGEIPPVETEVEATPTPTLGTPSNTSTNSSTH
jgi:hypothetical protein